MQKVLIISYFFPPCNLTASQRAYSWARYLKRYGYQPVILTRRWDNPVNTLSDVSKATHGEMLVETNEDCKIYYLPYYPNWRDKIYVRFGEGRFAVIRKGLTLIELLLQNFFTGIIPYSNIFNYAEEFVQNDREIKKVVITGNPFNLFKIGYSLQKKFGISWIADYRDAWTTSEINSIGRPAIFRLVDRLDKYFEKKWIGTASVITASSLPIAREISNLTGKQGYALYNGFVKDDFKGLPDAKFDAFTITYVGTLYEGQKVEIFCEAFKKLIDSENDIKIKLYFPGLAFYKKQAERISAISKGYEKYIECTPRMERKNILEIEKKSHLLFHVAWDEQKGIIASKIYEYLASGTYIIVAPTDHGSIEEIVQASRCGVCFSTVDEVYSFLKQEYSSYQDGKYHVNNTELPSVMQFSRENQAKRLAELLNGI